MVGFNWIIENKLAGASQPGLYSSWDNDIKFLRERNIDSVMSLTEEPLIGARLQEEGFKFFHFPIRDMDCPLIRPAYDALTILTNEIEKGHKFLIHCKGGVGRTGLVGACYLVMQGFGGEEAIKKVRIIHRPYIQTRVQEDFVVYLERYLERVNSNSED